METNATSRGRLYIALAAVLWSSSGGLTKVLTRDTPLGLNHPEVAALHIAFYRVLFAGLFFAVLLRPRDISFRPAMLPMLVCFAAMNAMFVSAMALGTAANAILLQYTAPIWVFLASIFWLGERADFRSLAAVALAMAGMGLIIGGGFPESFMAELEANASLRQDIRHAIDQGLPAYAECGGLMYLSRSIAWRGERREMAGVIPGDVAMHERPVGRGYVVLESNADHPWRSPGGVGAGSELHAHEFHYSAISGLPAGTRYAYAMHRGHGIDGERDGIVHRNLLASYTHLRATAGCDWPEKFVRFVRRKKAERASASI